MSIHHVSIATKAKRAAEIEISEHDVDQLIVEYNNQRLGIVRFAETGGNDPIVTFDRATGVLTFSHEQRLELVNGEIASGNDRHCERTAAIERQSPNHDDGVSALVEVKNDRHCEPTAAIERQSPNHDDGVSALVEVKLRCPDPDFLASSNLMRLVEIRGKGRGFVSCKEITPGTLLSVEQPFFKFSSATKENLGSGITVAAEVITLAANSTQFDRVQKAVELLGFHPKLETFEMVSDERLADVTRRLKVAIKTADIRPTADPQRMVRLLLQMECNSFYLGMLAYTAMFNHSCIPNATASVSNNGETMEVRAKRVIAVGEEITISYQQDAVSGFPGLPFDTQQKRQKHLSRCYSFDCTCQCCLDESPETEILLPGGTAKHMESIREQTVQISKKLAKGTEIYLLWKKSIALLQLAEQVLGPRNLCLYRAQGLVRRIAVRVLNTLSSEALPTSGVPSHREAIVLQTNAALAMLDTISHFTDRKDKMALVTLDFLIIHLQDLLMSMPDFLVDTKLKTATKTKTAINEMILWRDEIQAAYS